MFKVIDKEYMQSKTFSTAREVGIYLLGRQVDKYMILKQDWERVDLCNLENYNWDTLVDYLEKY